ncbi:MAG TPA: Nramp family divalent metal transporter [Saprospiraceae bacterium]|nr:Nramp family divalent metal transporter [Saprospiraceae bacterium]
MSNANAYLFTNETIQNPPVKFLDKLKYLGPGFIVTASIVGSGELIATTTLGAKAGYLAFWVIIVSCLIKVALQLEFGKHAIITGHTPMFEINALNGMQIKGKSWLVWLIGGLQFLKIIQLGGMLGSTALVLNMIFPSISPYFMAIFTAVLVAVLIYRNQYKIIEKGSLLMTFFFTLFTAMSLIMVMYTPYAITAADIQSGFRFDVNNDLLLIAVGVFGITGVAADEILAYYYWCLEKGYASFAGLGDDSEAWKSRVKGWMKIMYLDAFIAMVIYTSTTAAFYLLGAAVLHSQNLVPESNQLIETISKIYTDTLGQNVKYIYLIGAFFVLFSSVFTTLAYNTRVFTDLGATLNLINLSKPGTKDKSIRFFAVAFPVLWCAMYFFINSPLLMIISGGIVGSVMLFVVAYIGILFRMSRSSNIGNSKAFDLWLGLSVVSIMALGLYGVYINVSSM